MPRVSFKLALTILLIIAGFTLLDYLGHQILEKNADLTKVPDTYYRNKLIFGSGLLFLGVFIVDWLRRSYSALERPYYKASALTFFVILLLQLRYAYQGYSLSFHAWVLGLHYLALVPLVFYAQKGGYME